MFMSMSTLVKLSTVVETVNGELVRMAAPLCERCGRTGLVGRVGTFLFQLCFEIFLSMFNVQCSMFNVSVSVALTLKSQATQIYDCWENWRSSYFEIEMHIRYVPLNE